MPEPAVSRRQSTQNKQGRDEETRTPELCARVADLILKDQSLLYSDYESMLEDDIARELARINLPLSLYTEWYWQIDLHNLFHFIQLRTDPHAQWEIQEYGRALAKCAKAVSPMAYGAFEENRQFGARLSRPGLAALPARPRGVPSPPQRRGGVDVDAVEGHFGVPDGLEPKGQLAGMVVRQKTRDEETGLRESIV